MGNERHERGEPHERRVPEYDYPVGGGGHYQVSKKKSPSLDELIIELIELKRLVMDFRDTMDKHPNDADQWGAYDKMVKAAEK